VSIADDRYTVVVLRQPLAAAPEHFYSLKADAYAEGLSYRLLYIFRDEKGAELAKGYFMEGRRAVSPVGTASVEVEVMITSEGHGRLTLDGLCLVDGGAYQKRTAKVVALSSFVVTEPGPVWHRSYRDSVNETLASVDLVAEREHPDMMVLTENVFQTRLPSAEYRKHPNRLDGTDPDLAALCERARRYHTYITCSVHEVDGDGMISGVHMRCEQSKLTTVRGLQSIGFDTIACGDSHNDIDMIRASKAGFLFRSTNEIKAANPDLPAYEGYDELLEAFRKALAR
jgi:hypothetical protein